LVPVGQVPPKHCVAVGVVPLGQFEMHWVDVLAVPLIVKPLGQAL
jgi:hypothetical protein